MGNPKTNYMLVAHDSVNNSIFSLHLGIWLWLKGRGNGKFSLNGKFVQNGKLGHSCVRVTKGRLYDSRVRDHVIVHLGLNVSSSAHNCGCVVNGGNTMAAI